jgi:hypothetical protein
VHLTAQMNARIGDYMDDEGRLSVVAIRAAPAGIIEGVDQDIERAHGKGTERVSIEKIASASRAARLRPRSSSSTTWRGLGGDEGGGVRERLQRASASSPRSRPGPAPPRERPGSHG